MEWWMKIIEVVSWAGWVPEKGNAARNDQFHAPSTRVSREIYWKNFLDVWKLDVVYGLGGSYINRLGVPNLISQQEFTTFRATWLRPFLTSRILMHFHLITITGHLDSGFNNCFIVTKFWRIFQTISLKLRETKALVLLIVTWLVR